MINVSKSNPFDRSSTKNPFTSSSNSTGMHSRGGGTSEAEFGRLYEDLAKNPYGLDKTDKTLTYNMNYRYIGQL